MTSMKKHPKGGQPEKISVKQDIISDESDNSR